MTAAPKTANQMTQVEARIVHNALVVSFTGAGLPKVWRAELAHLATAALELRDDAGKVTLFLKTQSSTEDVYSFPDRESAAAGLKAITQALFSQERAATHSAIAPEKSGFFVRLLKYFFYGLLVLLALGALVTFLRPTPADILMKAAGVPPLATGVPVPADQLFGK